MWDPVFYPCLQTPPFPSAEPNTVVSLPSIHPHASHPAHHQFLRPLPSEHTHSYLHCHPHNSVPVPFLTVAPPTSVIKSSLWEMCLFLHSFFQSLINSSFIYVSMGPWTCILYFGSYFNTMLFAAQIVPPLAFGSPCRLAPLSISPPHLLFKSPSLLPGDTRCWGAPCVPLT